MSILDMTAVELAAAIKNKEVTVKEATEVGFKKALSAILDGNITTLIGSKSFYISSIFLNS